MVKNLPASAGATGDMDVGLILGSGSTPGGGNGHLLQYSCLEKIPWTKEPSRLQSMESQKVRYD